LILIFGFESDLAGGIENHPIAADRITSDLGKGTASAVPQQEPNLGGFTR